MFFSLNDTIYFWASQLETIKSNSYIVPDISLWQQMAVHRALSPLETSNKGFLLRHSLINVFFSILFLADNGLRRSGRVAYGVARATP